MPYDQYRNWKPGSSVETNMLKGQVLKDIEGAEDETDRLEILDSFEAYVERAHNIEVAEHISSQILLAVQSFLTGAILSKLPSSMPISRSRVSQERVKT
ncbi:hypothetical protein ES705_34105 [subsurface metagenome]